MSPRIGMPVNRAISSLFVLLTVSSHPLPDSLIIIPRSSTCVHAQMLSLGRVWFWYRGQGCRPQLTAVPYRQSGLQQSSGHQGEQATPHPSTIRKRCLLHKSSYAACIFDRSIVVLFNRAAAVGGASDCSNRTGLMMSYSSTVPAAFFRENGVFRYQRAIYAVTPRSDRLHNADVQPPFSAKAANPPATRVFPHPRIRTGNKISFFPVHFNPSLTG